MLEPVETLNLRLEEVFGIDTISGQAIWRIVWSDDQYEWRLSEYTPDGVKLLVPKVQWLPKYKQWIPHAWVLEQLVLVPDTSIAELPAEKMSYEPMFPFFDPLMRPIAPTWVMAEYVIQNVNALKGKKPAVYKDPDAGLNAEQLAEQKKEKLDQLTKALYPDETDISDALTYREGTVIDKTDYWEKEDAKTIENRVAQLKLSLKH